MAAKLNCLSFFVPVRPFLFFFALRGNAQERKLDYGNEAEKKFAAGAKEGGRGLWRRSLAPHDPDLASVATGYRIHHENLGTNILAEPCSWVEGGLQYKIPLEIRGSKMFIFHIS